MRVNNIKSGLSLMSGIVFVCIAYLNSLQRILGMKERGLRRKCNATDISADKRIVIPAANNDQTTVF